MEKFWAVILIFVVVAAAGLMYVNQVYIPQKDTQMAMAETANQTLTAVKSEMENDDTPVIVKGDSVIETVIEKCKEGNTISIRVDEILYKDKPDGIGEQVDPSKYYAKTVKREGGIIKEIIFKEIK